MDAAQLVIVGGAVAVAAKPAAALAQRSGLVMFCAVAAGRRRPIAPGKGDVAYYPAPGAD